LDSGFGQRLKGFRLAGGLTMADLARRAGLSRQAVRQYERGGMCPKAGRLSRLAAALGVEPGRLRSTDPRPDARHTWTAAELALLGQFPDPEVSRRTGKSLYGVRSRRWRLGIPAAGSLRN
jgi:transcriptional regulator with XRE-family HTH domain